MPKHPTIPDFDQTIPSMATALRAIKDVVEQLAGLRTDRPGAPTVHVVPRAPRHTEIAPLKVGDLWISDGGGVTPKGNVSYWDGVRWFPLN